MTRREEDIVTDILQRAMDVVRAEMGPNGLDRITVETLVARIGALEKPVRLEWRGMVAQRSMVQLEAVKSAALEEVRRTGNVAEAVKHHPISRATLYRLLSAKHTAPP